MLSLIAALAPILGDVLKRYVPDSAEVAKAQQDVTLALMTNGAAIQQAAAGIVSDEAKGQSWLQRNWRPLTMITFVALIVSRWLGYSAPALSDAEVLKLWDIVELGLGGYVIGRSAEKIVPQIVGALKAGK